MPTVIVNDTFTDTDGTLLTAHTGEMGATWTSLGGGNFTVQSNAVWKSAVGNVRVSGEPVSADLDIDAVIDAKTNAGQFAIFFRWDSATDNGYDLLWSSNEFRVRRRTGGVGTNLIISTAIPGVYTVKVTARGDDFELFVGGVSMGTAIDGTYSDPGIIGTGSAAVGSSGGGVHLRSLTVTDQHTNVAPVVNAGTESTATTGFAWTGEATFTDADSTSWTATVDYGDGTGAQIVTPGSGTVALSHTYATAGVYTVTVSVMDDSGSVGSNTVIVTVNALVPPDFSQVSDIFLVETARPGARGDLDTGSVEWGMIRGDVDALLLRPTITGLSAVPDVDTTGVVDGHTLIYDSMANDGLGGYVVGDPSGAISSVEERGVEVAADVSAITFDAGLEAYPEGTGRVGVGVRHAGTGGASTVSRSDHTHSMAGLFPVSIAESGSLSSGSRDLATTNITLTAGISYAVLYDFRPRMRGGGGGAAYHSYAILVDGVAIATSGTRYSVGGVPETDSFLASQAVAGTGVARTITARLTYVSTDPTYVLGGHLLIMAFPIR